MPEEHIIEKKAKLPKSVIYQKKFTAKPFYKGKVMVNISITYPQVEIKSNPESAKFINDFYKNNARKLYEYASHTLFERAKKEYLFDLQQNVPFREYEFTQTFEITYNLGNLMSLYCDEYEFTAGAHGSTTRKSQTFFLQDGYLMKLEDFFRGSYYKSIIYEYIIKEIKKQTENGETYYFDDYAKNVFRYFEEKNFYLNEKNFSIFYPLYTIAAYAGGIPVFEIPFNVFGSEIKRKFFE